MGVQRAAVGTTIVVVLALVVPLLAAGVWVFVAANESPLESASDIEPLIGTVETAERFQEAQVAIKVEYADAYSPTTNAAGTLTGVRIGPGDTVQTGTVVADVNNARVTAYVSDAPLFRDISRGMSGADVRVAQQLLETLGYDPRGVDGKAGPGTEAAIERYNEARGYGKDNPVLSLASLVWVGTTPVTVDEMSVTLGGQASPGTALFTTTAGLAAIAVTETPNVPEEAEVVLEVGEVTAPYTPGSGFVTDPESVVAIAESLGTVTEGVGTVRLATPVTVGTVPSSAVVSDESGGTCLFESPDSAPTAVEPLGGSLGTVDLDPALIGTPVLINPREVREDLSCG